MTKSIKKDVNKIKSVVETDEQTEYFRASETRRLLNNAKNQTNLLREELLENKRKNLAFDTIIKELAEKKKQIEFNNKILIQELEFYKTKQSIKKGDSKEIEDSLNKMFTEKDDYINQNINKGLDKLIEDLRITYNL